MIAPEEPAIYYSTSEEAEQAFYRAFEQADLAVMMGVWLQADYIICIHPLSNRLIGYDAIRNGWQEIFQNTPPIQFQNTRQQIIHKDNLAIHTINEKIQVEADPSQVAQMCCTHIYEQTEKGWHLILHHASPIRRETNKPHSQAPILH